MLRPGLHFGNACEITPADLDIIKRWSPLSLLEAMDNIVYASPKLLRQAWDLAGRPPLVLRRYYWPQKGGPTAWGAHASESVELARRCIEAGIPVEYLLLKPFNEPNMPDWANWEGFGDKPHQIERYNRALHVFIDQAKSELPDIRIGGPHLTVGNRDVKFANDPPGDYYYHGSDMKFESSLCAEALSRLDVHFVHCYGMAPGQYKERAHGLRFLEYEKYFSGQDIYIVEGAYGVSSGEPADQNQTRGRETVAYLRLLADFPQVKGIALWIGGDRGWFAFRHSDGAHPESHRPVVYAVEEACQEGSLHLAAEPQAEPIDMTTSVEPPERYKLIKRLCQAPHGFYDLRPEVESFCDPMKLAGVVRSFEQVEYLVWHHSGRAEPHTPLELCRWAVLQKSPPEACPPYHFAIDGEGALFFLSRIAWMANHTVAFDRQSVGCCFLGRYLERDPWPPQIETARFLCDALGEFFGGDWNQRRQLGIVAHRDLRGNDTACPGRCWEALIWRGRWPGFFRGERAAYAGTPDSPGERVDEPAPSGGPG